MQRSQPIKFEHVCNKLTLIRFNQDVNLRSGDEVGHLRSQSFALGLISVFQLSVCMFYYVIVAVMQVSFSSVIGFIVYSCCFGSCHVTAFYSFYIYMYLIHFYRFGIHNSDIILVIFLTICCHFIFYHFMLAFRSILTIWR